jgi:hypothetical protein
MNWRLKMKKTFLAAAALLLVAASPALAQSYDPDVGSGNLDSWPYTSDPDNPYASQAQISPYGAYGFDPAYGSFGFAPYGAYNFDPTYGGWLPAPTAHAHKHRR